MSSVNNSSLNSSNQQLKFTAVPTQASVSTTKPNNNNIVMTPVRPTKFPSNSTPSNGYAYVEPDSPIASVVKRTKGVSTPSTNPTQSSTSTPVTKAPARTATSTNNANVQSPTKPAAATSNNGSATGAGVYKNSTQPQPQQQSQASSPHLFSPKYDEQNGRQGDNSSRSMSKMSNSSNNSMDSNAMSQVQSGKLGSAKAILQTGPVHQYSPPCMQAVFRALSCKNNNNQILLSNLAEAYMEDEGVPEEEEFDPFYFIKSLPPLSSTSPAPRKSPIPPKAIDTPMVTLALDLDETLVHCSIQPIDNPEFTFHVNFNGLDYEVYVRIRPHLEYFLKQVSQWFEVVVFTASQKVYADSLLNIIDPMNEYISHRVFRDSCVCVDGNYLKDLNILGRPLDKVVIVDNSFQAFGFQLDNGIPIESWFDDENDSELLNLVPYLRHLKDSIDVRPYVRDTFRLQEFVDCLMLPSE